MTVRDHNKGLSYSMLNTANYCYRKYKYLFIDQLKPTIPKSIDLEFGTAIHTAIEAAFEGEDALEVFTTYWDSVNPKEVTSNRYNWKALKEIGEILIPRFVDRHLKYFKPEIIEERMYGELEGIPIEGTADFIGRYKGRISLVDFKTSNYAYPKHKISINEQMFLYSELYRQNYGKLPTQIVYIVFCKAQKRIQTITLKLEESKLLEMIHNVKEMCKDIKTRSLFPANRTSCMMGQSKCEFFDHCYPEIELKG